MSVKPSPFHGLHLIVRFTLSCLCFGFKQDCSPPDVPAEGSYEPKMNMFHPRSNVTYFCNDGLILNGSSIRECQFDGTWSGTTPFCDHEKTFKILRGSESYLGSEGYQKASLKKPFLFDGNTETCQLLGKGESIQVELEKEVVVRGVRLYLGNGFEDFDIYSGLGENMTLCANYRTNISFLLHVGWQEVTCGSSGVLADKIEIRKEGEYTGVYNLHICDMKVLGFGIKFDNGCTHPPEIRVDNGYFEVNRTKATLICEDGYTSENGGLDCGRNTWKGLAPKCERVLSFPEASTETPTHIITGVAIAGVLIILLLLGILIYLIRKQKATRIDVH